MFEPWYVAKGRKVQGGRILSQGTVRMQMCDHDNLTVSIEYETHTNAHYSMSACKFSSYVVCYEDVKHTSEMEKSILWKWGFNPCFLFFLAIHFMVLFPLLLTWYCYVINIVYCQVLTSIFSPSSQFHGAGVEQELLHCLPVPRLHYPPLLPTQQDCLWRGSWYHRGAAQRGQINYPIVDLNRVLFIA